MAVEGGGGEGEVDGGKSILANLMAESLIDKRGVSTSTHAG